MWTPEKVGAELIASPEVIAREMSRLAKEDETELTQKDIKAVFSLLEDTIFSLVQGGYRGANISTFAKIKLVERADAEFVNPKTQEKFVKPAGLMTYVKLSSGFKKRVYDLPIDIGFENTETLVKAYEHKVALRAKAEAKRAAKKAGTVVEAV